MTVEVTQETSWKRALDAARFTVGKESLNKEPSDRWKSNILLAEHSPIRLVEFDIKIKNAFNFVINHLVRHFIGFIPFVRSNRPDRNEEVKDDLQVNRLTPTSAWFSANAQALINVSRKRLCACASKETREVWQEVKNKVAEIDPIMASKMVKNCVYRGFCPELCSCGYSKTSKFQEDLKLYREGKV